MKLAPRQIEWINAERRYLQKLIASKPALGLIRYVAQEEALKMIIQLHNLEINVPKAY